MSNILVDDLYHYPPQRRNSCKSELKSFLSAKNLSDLHVSVKNSATFEALIPPANPNPQNPKHFYKNDQVSRLLDDLSDPENSVDHGNLLKGIVICTGYKKRNLGSWILDFVVLVIY